MQILNRFPQNIPNKRVNRIALIQIELYGGALALPV
jgi:hypothetical protein